MPSKGKQRASRQAQLRNKRRKSAKSQVVDSRVTQNSSPSAQVDSAIEIEPIGSTSETKPTLIAGRPAQFGTNVLRYEYLGSEIKRIAVAAAVIVILLVTLSFTSITA
ncbi:MAG: hypothetical protein NZ820_08220 [Dehalococcoidia bacterium]|jgi:hypothetical protein|uniref:Uncharacterized protein n=1 Tax=marine metagenome TaxID=408172 RepID=A0A381SRE7_9ZZZZ|nr:hypothetical protein [Chloroflexota bacterium]MBV46268.1 hypothetical protein [Dehalococcoidia bacterium]MCH2313785.1 hypothetical protein [SAR202 cluster bacterium]MCS5649311.1 hypothetical protein [Dehalococcoidia bacterium]MEC7913477.1 hypothetical protein [Chloroflexota bacterium]|tara:strand:+ start:37 stop:360 length:324 start_codon:yes stop_codon:yes gene_type:complete